MNCSNHFIKKLVVSLPRVRFTRQYSVPRIRPDKDDVPQGTLLHTLLPFKNSVDFYGLLQRTTLTFGEVKEWRKWKKIKHMRADQKFMPERHKFLGPDLAAAQFFVFRGGKIKFRDNEKWLEKENLKSGEIPSQRVPGLFVEGIDVSGTSLLYEGFDNLVDLKCLKSLLLKDCEYVDDFCFQRLHVVADTLERLDISGCLNVTERGLCTLHQLKHLKELVIHNTPAIAHKELTCLLLQEVLPECKIVGVDYEDVALWQRLGNYLDIKEEELIEAAKAV